MVAWLCSLLTTVHWLQDAESFQQLLSTLPQHGSLPELDDAGVTLQRMFATQQRSRVCSVQSQRHRSRPQPEQGATLRRLFQTQQLPSAQHMHSAAGTYGATLRRLFQTQQLPSAQHTTQSAAGTQDATLRRLFQTQQLPSAQHNTQSAADTPVATLRRLFQTQQLPAAQQHAAPAEEPDGATMCRLFQTLPEAQPAGSDPLQPQDSLQPSRAPSRQKLSRQRSFRPGAALPAEVAGAGKQVVHAIAEVLNGDQVGCSAA